MAEDKDSLLDLKSELSALTSDLGDSMPEEGADISTEMMDLKRRMDKSDKEMRAMTEAMKSTLLDVRALMQDMDNPFNMLREMGVDKLVNKAVETVEDEVMKQKREEAKRRMVRDEKKPETILAHQGAAPQAPPAAASSAPSPPRAPSPQTGIPLSSQDSPPSLPTQQTGGSPMSGYSGSLPGPVNASDPYQSQPALQPSAGMSSQTETDVRTLMKRVNMTEQAVPMILNRVSRTEEAVEELTNSVQELLEDIKGSRPRRQERVSRYAPRYTEGYDRYETNQAENIGEVYYEAYISLVADYLVIRFGEKGSEEILLEGMYKGWASPKVVRDIMDHISTNAKTMSRKGGSLPPGLNIMNSDLEDKILLTSLLKNLDKPASEWSEPTHLFLLLALVTRARETKLNRAET